MARKRKPLVVNGVTVELDAPGLDRMVRFINIGASAKRPELAGICLVRLGCTTILPPWQGASSWSGAASCGYRRSRTPIPT